MNQLLDVNTLAAMGAQVAVLGARGYALPVRFQVRGAAVECRVPTWSGIGDLLEQGPAEVTLVASVETGPWLRWLFLRGTASVIPHPDWTGPLAPPASAGSQLSPDDLYHLVRMLPTRMEQVDEAAGWGVRETADLDKERGTQC